MTVASEGDPLPPENETEKDGTRPGGPLAPPKSNSFIDGTLKPLQIIVQATGTEGFLVNVVSSALFVLVALAATVVYTKCEADRDTDHRLAETIQQFEIEDYKSNQLFLSEFSVAVPRSLDLSTRIMMQRNYMKWAEKKRNQSSSAVKEFPRHPVTQRTYEDISKDRYDLQNKMFERAHAVGMCPEIHARFAALVPGTNAKTALDRKDGAAASATRLAALSVEARLDAYAELMVTCFREINGVTPDDDKLRDATKVIRDIAVQIGLDAKDLKEVVEYTKWFDTPATSAPLEDELRERSDNLLRAYSPVVNHINHDMIAAMSTIHTKAKQRLDQK